MGLRSKLNLSGTVPETNLGSKTSVDLTARGRGREEEVRKKHFWSTSSLCFWSRARRDEPRRSSVLTEDTSSLANLTTGRRKISLCQRLGAVPLWAVVAILTACIVIPCAVMVLAYKTGEIQFPYGNCVLLPEYRVPCLLGVINVQQQACESANCCWNDKTEECFHSIPSRHAYTDPSWEDEGGTVTGRKILSPRLANTPFNTKYFTQLHALITPVSKTHLQILMSIPSARVAPVGSKVDLNDTDFNVTMYGPEFSFDVYRRNSNQSSPMITTTRGPNIASVNYREIGVQCPRDGIVYGLGQLKLKSTTKLYNTNISSSSYPIFMCLNSKGQAHGIFINNTGPMEVSIIEKTNLISIRALSGSYWDINLLSGPTPKDVMDQLTEIIGKPKLTPYWSLGFHVCRDFSSNGMNLTSVNVTEVLRVFSGFHDDAKDWKLPYESDCIHERLLNDLNFSTSSNVLKSLSSAFDRLQKDGKKFLLSLSPQTVDLDEEFAILADTSYRYVGSYRGRNVSYPDFLNPKTADWLKLQLNSLISSWTNLEKTLKGYVLIDNWPQDDSNYTREKIPYVPDSANGTLSEGTLWWTARQMSNTPHYEIHNKYGLLHAGAVSSATGSPNDSLLLSGSCYTGGGSVAGCLHRSTASWDSLSEAVEVALGQGLAGVPLPGGSSICGSDGNYTEELCLRWYSLGVVLPLMRVSSQLPLRDPVQLSSKADIQSVKTSLLLRYSLLPYYYTLLREASQTGTPIIRPMFMEFPTDNRTWDLNQQFMVGSSLLAVPGLKEGAVTVEAYLPDESNTTWYLLAGGHPVNNGTGNITVIIPSSASETVLLVRGGHIVPTQEPGTDAASSRNGTYKLIIGLQCDPDDPNNCSASGRMTLEEGVTLYFTANSTSVTVDNLIDVCSKVPTLPELVELKVFGLQNPLPPDPTTTAEPTMTEDTDTSWEDETTLFSTSDDSTISTVPTTITPISTSLSGSTSTFQSTESTDSTTSDTTPASSASSVESTSTLSTESTDSTTSDTTPASNASSVESSSALSTESTDSTTSDTTPASSASSVESTSTLSTESTDSTTSDTTPASNASSVESSSALSTESTDSTTSDTTPASSASSVESTSTLSTESTDSTTSDTTPASNASSVESSSTLSTESTDSTTSDTTPASSASSVESKSTLSTESTDSTSDTTPASSAFSVESASTSKLQKLRDSALNIAINKVSSHLEYRLFSTIRIGLCNKMNSITYNFISNNIKTI